MRLPSLPSLPIAHQLALLIGACMVFAVLAVGGVSLWNLKSGFGQYLRQRDEEHITRLMVILERRAQDDPQMQWLRGDYEAMRELQDDAEGLDPNRPAPPPPPARPARLPIPMGRVLTDARRRHLGAGHRKRASGGVHLRTGVHLRVQGPAEDCPGDW